ILLAGAACRHTELSRALDPGMASCIPADTAILAGIDLVQLRSSTAYPSLPAVPALAEAFPEAARLLVGYNGKDLLLVAGGAFRSAPTGWTQVEPGLALSGSDTAVHS